MPFTLLSTLSALAVSAAPVPVGQIAEISGPESNIMIMRADETLSVSAGDMLLEGDKVIAKAGSTATVAAYGCSTEVADLSLLTVNPAMCDAGADISFGYAQGAGWAGLSNATKTLIFVAGTAGTIAIVDAAVADDDDPASP